MLRYFLIAFLILLTACSTPVNQEITGNVVKEPVTIEKDLASTDCRVVIKILEQEIINLEQEKTLKEVELGKKLREARAIKDDSKLATLNKEIDALSQRVKELRKGLLPTLQTQLELKQKNCA
ncbi:MAG: hypothetical protein Q7R96_05680 [Nanoarchaeota archaeon]|nr:hypothetical protein [Nanoarchaeota archaeon]